MGVQDIASVPFWDIGKGGGTKQIHEDEERLRQSLKSMTSKIFCSYEN